MQLTILRKPDEIAAAQKSFENAFRSYGQERLIKTGHMGESHQLQGYELTAEGIWVGFRRLKNRFWNAFGLTTDFKSIVCEIKFPFSDVNPRVAGALASDSTGHIWVLHRGRIGGGKKGIGKQIFEKNFRGSRMSVEGEEMAVVGSLSDSSFIEHVAGFVKQIAAIKTNANMP